VADSVGSNDVALVSVVIPTYNSSSFVSEAINSVLAQTYSRVEVVVVNDGSTDNTEAVLASYGDRIKAVTQVNSGTSAARNTGIGASSGQFVAFLDHDDLWSPSKLTLQMALLKKHPEMGMVYCGRQFFNHYTGQVTSKHPAEPQMGIHDFLALKAIALQSVVIPRAVLNDVGLFDVTISGADDWEMCLRISSKYPVCGIPDILVDIRGHENQQSIQSEYMYGKIQSVFERYQNVHGVCAECSSAVAEARSMLHEAFYQRMLGSAKSALKQGKYAQGTRMLLRGIWENPVALTRVPKRLAARLFRRAPNAGGAGSG
jgi:glycosyltransferase involved in cell wall biosynthesis